MNELELEIVPVACGVWTKGDCVFVSQRRGDQKFPYQWEFPGGKIELHETPREALIREWKEELAVQITPGEFLMGYQYPYPDATVYLHFWEIENVVGEIDQSQFNDVAWMNIRDLRTLDLVPGDVMCVREIEFRKGGM
jgi:8-oxo-dGTP diphosphatase